MGEVGIEPTIDKNLTDLQSVAITSQPFFYEILKYIMERNGLAPIFSDHESAELLLILSPKFFLFYIGFEPITLCNYYTYLNNKTF